MDKPLRDHMNEISQIYYHDGSRALKFYHSDGVLHPSPADDKLLTGGLDAAETIVSFLRHVFEYQFKREDYENGDVSWKT